MIKIILNHILLYCAFCLFHILYSIYYNIPGDLLHSVTQNLLEVLVMGQYCEDSSVNVCIDLSRLFPLN